MCCRSWIKSKANCTSNSAQPTTSSNRAGNSGKRIVPMVASWISNNTNLPISAEQIQSVLGQGPLQDLASKMGLSTDAVAGTLSEQLPGLVDQLTPNGELPSGDLMSQGLGMLKGFMKS